MRLASLDVVARDEVGALLADHGEVLDDHADDEVDEYLVGVRVRAMVRARVRVRFRVRVRVCIPSRR